MLDAFVKYTGMRRYLPYYIGQNYLLPPNVNDWLSEDHPARFVLQVVTEELDLSEIVSEYESPSGRGAPPLDPKMMTALLIYGYAFGVRSSRKLEALTYDDLAVRYLTANQQPDHDSIANFRKRHKASFDKLFHQSLVLAAEVGLINLGEINLYVDGSKILAYASRHQTVNYARIRKDEAALEEIVAEITAEAEAIDEAEDHLAAASSGDAGLDLKDSEKLRKQLRAAKERLARAAAARAEMERSAQAQAEKTVQEARQKSEEHAKEGKRGRKPVVPDVDELAKKLRDEMRTNLTDPDSRLMIDGATKAIVQAYNAQVVTAGGAQIILACSVTSEENDIRQLAPMGQLVADNLQSINEDPNPRYQLGADNGYLSVEGVRDPRLSPFDLYVAPGRSAACTEESTDESCDALGEPVSIDPPQGGYKWHVDPPAPAPRLTPAAILREEMRAKISTPDGKEFYNHRSDGVEPVFAEIKEARGTRRFLLKGIENVAAEWNLICLGHNLRKLFRHARRVKQASVEPRVKQTYRRKCDSESAKFIQMAF
jgi:transposase